MRYHLFEWAPRRKRSFKIAPFMPLVILLLLSCPTGVRADPLQALNTRELSVFHDRSLEGPAREIAGIYPSVRDELETTLGLRADFRPSVMLLSDRAAFEQATGSRLIVAYAVPSETLMVIDYPRASEDPFSTRAILKHELCHLVLHRHIPSIPRWLDEGICQWASDGLAELLSERRRPSLPWIGMSGALFPLRSLDLHFPQDERGLAQAYDQSRSVIDYVVSRYGPNSIPNLLFSLQKGLSLEDAFRASLGTSLSRLEEDWRDSIGTWPALLAFIMTNIYTVIFFLAALSTVAGYVRYRIRKRRLREEEEEELIPGNP